MPLMQTDPSVVENKSSHDEHNPRVDEIKPVAVLLNGAEGRYELGALETGTFRPACLAR